MNIVEKNTRYILNSFAGMFLFAVSLAAFYMPYEIRIIPDVRNILVYVSYICAGLLVISFFFLYASSLTVFRNNWGLLAGMGFVGVLILSTRMNGGDMEGALGTYGLAGVFLVMDIAVFFHVNPKKYILITFFFFLAVNIVNVYTVYKYWNVGMWETYGQYRNTFYSLIGNYNGGIEYVLPMAVCGSAYAARYGKWLDFINYPAMAMCLVMALKCDSETQIIAFAAIILFMILGNFAMLSNGFARFLRIVFQPVILLALDCAVFVCVVVINKTNWVQKIGIDPDFHNRRHIWNMSMDWIKSRPIWGNGQETVAQEASKITGYAHSHCTYLEIAYKTGFTGSVFMLLMLAAAVVGIYRCRHNRVSFMLTAMLFILGLSCIAETYPMVYVMLCLGLTYYIAKNTGSYENASGRIHKMEQKPADEGHNAG